jgi:monoamine oxidase
MMSQNKGTTLPPPGDPAVLVLGAGIAGLRAARLLRAAGHAVTVLEARDRVGGRALSLPAGEAGALDLGPAWLWPQYQPRVRRLIEQLGLTTLPQFEQGALLYQDQSGGVRAIDYPRRYGDALRVRGGLQRLALALLQQGPAFELHLSTEARRVEFGEAGVTVSCRDGRVFRAAAVIAALPPPISASLSVSPPLPEALVAGLLRYPTWMAAQAKFVARYERPFWRTAGLSGSAVSHCGPMMEINDHGDPDLGIAALFGFLGLPPAERQGIGPQGLRAACLEQLVALFGADAASPLQVELFDWAREPFTATTADLVSGQGHPPYGDPALGRSWFDGRLLFACAEAAPEHGGLVEGALLAAERAVGAVLPLLARLGHGQAAMPTARG